MVLRLRIVRCYIESNLRYDSDTWTLMTADKKTLMATEIWFLRRMQTKWTDKVTNEEDLKRFRIKRWMMNAIAKGQASFFGNRHHQEAKNGKSCNDRQNSWQKITRKTEKTVFLPDREWSGIQQTEVLLREANTSNLKTVNVH